mmetsp:Transcript_112024/g.157056  ORF Transcript_112024/g.157056 Transcript_112024/m.157056 type:complete len:281 (-) Transcript_112024:68-910(-)
MRLLVAAAGAMMPSSIHALVVQSQSSYPQCGKESGAVFLQGQPTKDAFDHIYRDAVWGGDGVTSSKSGTGSSWGVGTQLLCKTITEALMEVAAERGAAGQSDFELNLLDAPSGDFFWMPGCLEHISSKLPEGAKLNYQGVDVSTVAKDTAEGKRASVQASLPKVKIEPFLAMDLSETNILERTFPGKKFDVINCHDALQHNPLSQVKEIVANFNKCANRLVVDVDMAGTNAQDISPGQFRAIDLTDAPFNNKPECLVMNPDPVSVPEKEHFAIFKLPLKA